MQACAKHIFSCLQKKGCTTSHGFFKGKQGVLLFQYRDIFYLFRDGVFISKMGQSLMPDRLLGWKCFLEFNTYLMFICLSQVISQHSQVLLRISYFCYIVQPQCPLSCGLFWSVNIGQNIPRITILCNPPLLFIQSFSFSWISSLLVQKMEGKGSVLYTQMFIAIEQILQFIPQGQCFQSKHVQCIHSERNIK